MFEEIRNKNIPDEQIIKILTNQPAYLWLLDVERSTGNTILHDAILQNRETLAEYLSEKGPIEKRLDIPTKLRSTPLLLAVGKMYPKVVKTLLERGASISRQNNTGETVVTKFMQSLQAYTDELLANSSEIIDDEQEREDKDQERADINLRYRQVFQLLQSHGAEFPVKKLQNLFADLKKVDDNLASSLENLISQTNASSKGPSYKSTTSP